MHVPQDVFLKREAVKKVALRGAVVADPALSSAKSRSRPSPLQLRLRVHVSHVPEEHVLAAGLVAAEVAVEHGRRAAHGAQVTLKTRLPRVTLAALGTHEHGPSRVLRTGEIVDGLLLLLLLHDRTEKP